MLGDYEWANEYLAGELGERWLDDDWGQGKLDVALYTEGLSDSFQHDSYYDFLDYMWDEYGYDFEDGFDWDAYREWYDSQ